MGAFAEAMAESQKYKSSSNRFTGSGEKLRTTQIKAQIQVYNNQVRKWGKDAEKITEFAAPSGYHRSNEKLPEDYRTLKENVKAGFRSEGTEFGKKVYAIGFNFPIQGVMIHYGAGRGQGGAKGSKWLTAKGFYQTTNPDSLGKAGSGNRRQNNWFNSRVKAVLPKLENIVETLYDGATLNATNIYIKDGETDS